MAISQQEFDTIPGDETKRIDEDLAWVKDEDHSPALEFRAEVSSKAGYPLFVAGRYNASAGTLSYAVIHRNAGRIYALDLGADHHNPECDRVGEKHKHKWNGEFRDKQAYVPEDITETWDRPLEVWKQFCAEANISHRGIMHPPVARKESPL